MLTVYHNLKGRDMEYWLHLQTAMRSDREITIDRADLKPVVSRLSINVENPTLDVVNKNEPKGLQHAD
ncbi:hypothetical protein Q2T42_25925 [Leptolyngbya boryana CZ1]|uniref:Uncharacterized protein n=1 Tax=Leptolyngbya boryana CZ1 TaxID=3060204 RepID=A0AA96X481_LEPBY|nr:hypothetical protein [Leptolyngbya boryana]WNZ45230.1 hypothetical protein Q2T42_25925 [Leptolyngbya boryana CZ1]